MKVLMIIAQKDFRDEELFDTRSVLEQNGIKADVCAKSHDIAAGKLGGTVKPDLAFSDVVEADYSGIIIIGGPGAFDFIGDETINGLVNYFHGQDKLVAAICIAPAILARGGFLKNKKATICAGSEKYLVEGEAIVSADDIVIDGNMITANGPAAASRFGQAIVDFLKNR
ncbi:DJ-1/PfpI family protein [Patescibacteria group bacterium]|nr:DJ-1/PfpI family protein [Patescibacteria group bacterium]